jgi:peptide/nickel transport system substrate-binding protein
VISALGPLALMGQPVAVRALDPQTLAMRFAAPFAPAMRLLDRHPIAGFGPFVEAPADRKRTGPLVFRRNWNYWRKAADGSTLPYLDEIVLADGASGPKQQDFADSAVAAEDFEELKKAEQSGKLRLFELGPGLDADALWFSASAASPLRRDKPPAADLSRPSGTAAGAAKEDRPWLGSETLRLAISAAVDRRAYCKQVFYGACDPMAGPVSPANIAWFNPDFPLGQANPELARAMLAELGLRDRNGDGILDDAALRPLRFTLLIRRDVPSSARAATFLAGTLKAIGVLMDVTPLSASALAARRQKGAYEAIYDRIDVNDTDPAMNLDFWLSSGAAHPWNPARSAPPADWERQIDQLMMKNASTFDRAERLQAFVDAQKLYLQHVPAIFFGAPYVRVTTSIRTLNATPSPLRPHLLWNADSLAALK